MMCRLQNAPALTKNLHNATIVALWNTQYYW